MDGEDIVQETLFEAYRKLDQFDDSRPLKPWLFGIAHHRPIDFLRKRKARTAARNRFGDPGQSGSFRSSKLECPAGC